MFDTSGLVWTRPPRDYRVTETEITVTTEPHTDLWQRTYYGFRNDNAPVLQMETEQEFFSFVVKTDFPPAIIGLTSAVWRCTWTATTG